MASQGHFRTQSTSAASEIDALVAVLEGRHGIWAAEVAEFFATLHGLKGDSGRSSAWANVAEHARQRAEARQSEH
jgi:hypothetical protein